MLALVLRSVPAAVLLGAALLKLASPRAAQEAFATFRIRPPAARWVIWGGLVVAELALAAGVVAGVQAAAIAAAALQLGFALALAWALRAGRAGLPCGCFGARSRVRPSGVARNLVLAAAFAGAALLPRSSPTTEEWLALGLAVALVAIALLAVAVLALARQVGELRLAVGPQAALEIEHEGPEIGSRTALLERFPSRPGARYALAVFGSEGCPACAAVEPAVALLARDPLVVVRTFDEHADADAWRALDVPGAPYAVALDREGTVLAKGTFNNLPQLESVLGTAERRGAQPARA